MANNPFYALAIFFWWIMKACGGKTISIYRKCPREFGEANA